METLINIEDGDNIVVHIGTMIREKHQGARDTRFRLKVMKRHLAHRYWEKKEESIKCVATPGIMKEYGEILIPYTKLLIIGEMRTHSFINEITGEVISSEVLYIKSAKSWNKR